jgi:hypothetical protein
MLLAFSPRRPDVFQMLTFLIFGILGLKTTRGSVWFGILMAPVLAVHIQALVKKPDSDEMDVKTESGSVTINWIFTALLIGMVIISLPWFKERLPLPEAKAGLISSETPVEAVRFLTEHKLPAPVFHAMSYGSYMIWAAQPDFKVFVDPRIELYPLSIWKDYYTISNVQSSWEERLSDYGIQTLLINPLEQSGLANQVSASAEWVRVYEDAITQIYTRSHP